MRIGLKTGLLSLFFILYSYSPTPVFAQDSLSLSIYPPLIEIVSQPGKMISQTYELSNQSKEDVEVVVRVLPFKPKGTQGKIDLFLNKASFDKSINWFSLENPGKQINIPFKIKAEQTEKLALKIKIPLEAEEKDYYYSLTIKALPHILSKGQTRAKINGLIGSNLLLTVSQTEKTSSDLNIQVFRPINSFLFSNIFDSLDIISFQGIVKNKGKNFQKIEGKIEIKDLNDKTIQNIPLLPTNVLSGAEREVICLDKKNCQLSKKPFWGSYQAVLTLQTPKGDREKSFYFYIFPFKTSAFLLILLIPLIFFIKFIKLPFRLS